MSDHEIQHIVYDIIKCLKTMVTKALAKLLDNKIRETAENIIPDEMSLQTWSHVTQQS